MYGKISVGLRMEPWGTPALTGYCCQDLPSTTTQSHLLLRKEEKKRPNIWPETPKDQHTKFCQMTWIYHMLELK